MIYVIKFYAFTDYARYWKNKKKREKKEKINSKLARFVFFCKKKLRGSVVFLDVKRK